MDSNLQSLYQLQARLLYQRQLWLRLLIVAAILLLALAVGAILPPAFLELLLLAFVLGGVGLALLRWPPLGLLLATVTGLVSPYYGPSGLNDTMVLIALLLVLWGADMVLGQKEVRLVSSRTMRPILLFLLVSLLSFGLGQLPWFAFARPAPLDAQVGGLAIFVLSAGAFLLVAHRIRELRWLKAMTWLFLATAGLFVMGRWIPGVVDLARMIFQPNSAGGVFWAWVPALAMSQALFNRTLHPLLRVSLLALVVGALYVGYVQHFTWKSGWIPQIVALTVVVAVRSWRAGTLVALLGALPFWNLIQVAAVSDQYSLTTRFDAWVIVGRIVEANPLLGLGFANYYWYTPLFPIRGWVVEFNSHNNYLDIVAQTGLLGLFCFLWFAWEMARLGWWLRARVPEGFPRAYVYGALGGLAGTLVAGLLGDWMLSFVYNIGLQGFRTGVLAWLFLGGLVVLERIYGSVPDRPRGAR